MGVRWWRRVSEPLAVVGPGQAVILSPLVLSELLAALQSARLSRQTAGVVAVMRRAAIDYQLRRLRERTAGCAVVAPSPVVEACEGHGCGVETVGAEEAARLLSVSSQRVRVLAAGGAFPGARKARCRGGNGRQAALLRWCIPAASVRAYLASRAVS